MQSISYVRCVRRLWGPAQASQLLKVTNLHRSVRQLQHKKVMEDNKPWALISEVGEQGYLEEFVDIIKQRFQIICLKDFLQNPQLHGPKIQAMLVWVACPAAEPSLLSLLPSLKVVANGGVGIDHLDVPYISSLGVKVTNTPGVVSDATADMAMGLLLASARKIVEGHQIAVNPNSTHMSLDLMGDEVTGSTMGIIGMGDIGCKIAKRGKGFDMKILYHNRNRRSIEDEQAVVNISRGEVNISRGLVVDQDALVKALQSGTIHAAALDVTYPEPLPRDHPLLGLPNVVITPHYGTNTYTTTRKMVQRMVENAVAAVNGQSVPNEVKPK